MNRFDYWLIADYTRVGARDQQTFLHMLKFEEGNVARTIVASLEDWATCFVAETGQAHFWDTDEAEAQRIITALKEHFATELAAITE